MGSSLERELGLVVEIDERIGLAVTYREISADSEALRQR
jgi:hypothetical protein